MPKRSLLLLWASLLATPASADTLTLGWWDHALGGGVTPIASSPGTHILLINQLLGSGFGFGAINALLIPNATGAPTFETAWNNGFAPPQGGTIRLYGSWQGTLTAGNSLTLPTIWQTNEMPSNAGFVVAEQVFLCGAGSVFCDNYIVPGGQLVGEQIINGVLQTDFVTLTGLAPGQPFTINEVFTFSQDKCCNPALPQGDVGAAILTTPRDDDGGGVHGAPGPLMGAGLPVLLIGGGIHWIVRRKKRSSAP